MTNQEPKPSRHKVTGKHKIMPGLSIYQTAASPFWYARMYDPVARKDTVRSTKFETKREAIEEAKRFISIPTIFAPKPAPVAIKTDQTFAFWADRAMDANRAKGKKGEGPLRDELKLLNRKDDGLLEYFGRRDIGSITSADINEYFLALDDARDKELSPSTKSKHVILFGKIFNAAIDGKAIQTIPRIPKFSLEQVPRIAFTDEEYKHLLKVTRDLAKKGEAARGGRIITNEMYFLAMFMVNTFVRPTKKELFGVKLGAITLRDNPTALSIKIDGKTGKREAVSMQAAVDIFQRQVRHVGISKKTDYLFFPDLTDRAEAIETARLMFNHILEKADLKKDYEGNVRSMYSLRHYAIQSRIRNSGGAVNLYSLAKVAGTSLDMLEKFYVKRMGLSDELIENLQYTKTDA